MSTDVRKIQIYDTTLRDGAQSAGIHFSAEDKKRIARRLASFGMDWIEGGWPGASPTDDHFFELMRGREWTRSKLVAFGSTARPGHAASEDAGLARLIASGADAACIFGKSWDLHVTRGLGIELEDNLELVRESVRWLKQHMAVVMFDAEHFFDGFRANEVYAMQVLDAAAEAGADALILCDTNGGSLPEQVASCVRQVVVRYPQLSIGIHAHNDSEMAVANTIAAVSAGASHVQGTVNGIGERCGNANLISVIPALILKMGLACGIDADGLKRLRRLSVFVNEMANQLPWQHQPYVGQNAFAHKGGIHVSAIRKESRLYEHIDPASVGNVQRVLVSNQAGRSNILAKLKQLELDADIVVDNEAMARVVQSIKEMEAIGYAFEGADASFQLLLRRATGHFKRHFELVRFRVYDEKRGHNDAPESEATVQVRVDGRLQHTAALGIGPVNAMDRALRAALVGAYPGLEQMRLTDFKVRVLSTRDATEAAVRVLIESSDGVRKWNTVGVSTDVLEATYRALNDAIEYKLVLEDQVAREHEAQRLPEVHV
ncbi:citramalate synthase [Mariprofundus erugo]|uniref:Citramalate synthase n=1 Tax=Mariprofundus erugo TaxID=2528639 RepID=A0A5R9GW99_9PROT|nr:citramalate synthase [Mariprofundus erugo]TLS68307.1 citramalate synthase [Mariprofundus erugo]TLS77161.1 citramalate synthase [Mariprofundus erugo]